MQKSNLKSYLNLHLIVFIWGFTAVLGALISLEALGLVWYRMLFALIFIFFYMILKKINLKISFKDLGKLLFLGVIIALHWFTFFKAIKVSNISVTLACLSSGALFTSVLEPFFYKRKIILYEVFFGLLVVLGLYIIFKVEGDYTYGILLALTSAFLSALFSVFNGKLASQMNASVISFYELLGGTILLTLFLIYSNSFTLTFFKISFSDLFYLLILSSICTAYAFIQSVKVMRYISPYSVMLTINLEPVYGIILALIFFNEKEQMNSTFYFGALIILATVLLNGVVKYYEKDKLL